MRIEPGRCEKQLYELRSRVQAEKGALKLKLSQRKATKKSIKSTLL